MTTQHTDHGRQRWMRRAVPLLGTLTAHGALAWLALQHPPMKGPAALMSAARAPISMLVLKRTREPPPPAPPSPPPPLRMIAKRPPIPPAALRPRTLPSEATPRTSAPSEPTRGEPASPSPAAPSSEPPRAINLFPKSVMERFGGEVPASSGAAGQGGKAPNGDSDSDGVAARAQRNITGWLSDGEGRARVAKGFVAPRWRQLERTLQQTFKPPPELVRREHRTVQVTRQIWTAYSRVSKPPQANEPPDREYLLGMPEGANYRAQPQAQIAAVQEAWEGPTYWRRIELELTMESDGRVTSTRVTRSSGKLGLDELAARAVRKTAAEGGPLDEPGPVTTLWAVETTVVVTPPDRIGFSFDESGTLSPGAKGIRRFIGKGKYPMQEQVRTRVSLLAHHGAGGRPSGSP